MKNNHLDEHGQPLNRNLSAKRLTHRTIDELIGLCKGIQADGILHDEEVKFLARWLEENFSTIEVWPVSILAERINKIMKDGIVDDDEKNDLVELLSEITGYRSGHENVNKSTGEIIENLTNASSLLPLDKPAPNVVFENKLFCLTGKFFYGSRKKCEEDIAKRGGKIQSSPNKETTYIVIGLLGSSDWKHSTYGTKIEYGIQLKEKGSPLSIISEGHWAKYI
ncbi:MAG: hypothetical protein A2X93_08465 [Deltaproteobacteria bacterium GWC2_56_8]|nr:MAG: hypothetical protein A2X99_04370 [Deltaproteobacteria bacterium GWB2_55_19]OGP37132.1 MAG: hypothetical protein A2X93_08465 [Deltaproteobacteria bacterium GWC2_56_8]HAO92948.1 hypothetical protein [Deltaproteobacteria bacterium]